jgi:tetratricopeptide (TPR) repeat protein
MRIVFILVALLGLTPTLLNAMYGDVETKKVPTARVITNLERQFQTNPKDPNVAWRIARLHGMAYAQGIDSVDVYTNIDAERFFEEEPPLVHSWVIRPDNEEQETEARQHLQEAIAWYEKAHVLNPWSVVVSLGYGWCLEQVGRKREAIATYREIVDGEFAKGKRGPWPQPQPGVSVVPNKAVTGEALRYLIDLLNPVVDRNELQTRREQLEDLDTWPVWITPIAIPLGGRSGNRRYPAR